MIACLAFLAGCVRGPLAFQREPPGGTVGAQLLDLAPDTIGLRYRMRVNASGALRSRKVVFIGVRTVTPGVTRGGFGTIDLDVFTHWVQYQDDLGFAGWPEQGVPHLNQPSLWLRNVDYNGTGRVGLRPLTLQARRLFPRQCAGIDRVKGARAGLTSIAAIHQGSILGRDVRLTLVRQPLAAFPAQLDWGHRFTPRGNVTPMLPAGRYWPWHLTVETSGEPVVQLLFLLDEARGRYMDVNGGVTIRTEFFFRPDVPQNLEGVLQLFVWDAETLREGRTTWLPRERWSFGEGPVPRGRAPGYGFRTANHRGQSVLEVGYALGGYARVGDVLEIGSRAP